MSRSKLRFKDDNGNAYPNWQEKTVEEVGDLTGSGIDKKIKEGEVPVRLVNFMDVYKNSFIKSDILNHWVTAPADQIKEKSIKRGDVFFTPSSETPDDIALPSVAIEDILDAGYSYHIYRLRPTIPVIPEFMTYSFNSEFFHKQACVLSQGSGTRYTIPLSKFKEMKTLIPSLPEQEKIAALFSKLDERIELREQKIAKLREYKKGLQQAVFGNNGERTLRFKDTNGNDYPDWVEAKLGDVATMFKGKGLSKKDISDYGSSCILYGQLYTTYGTIINNPLSNTNAIIEKPVLSQRGDILMPSSGETSEAIVVASVVNFDEPAILGGDLNVIRVDQSIINPIFLSYQIRSSLKQEISQVAQGHTVVHLYNSQLQEVKTLVPCLEEQEKIANLFSKIDNQIELEEKLLQAEKDEKQGLMQRVF